MRPTERHVVELASGVSGSDSRPRAQDVDFLHVTYDVGGSSSPDSRLMRHQGREYGHVLTGRLGVQLGFEQHDLGPGDSIAFDSTIPHRLWNLGDEVVHRGLAPRWAGPGNRPTDRRRTRPLLRTIESGRGLRFEARPAALHTCEQFGEHAALSWPASLPGEHAALHGCVACPASARTRPCVAPIRTRTGERTTLHGLGAWPAPDVPASDAALHGLDLARVHSACWVRTASASTRPRMASSLPASQSVAPTLASRVPLPSTLVTGRTSRPATLSATALRISAAAARADTATVQNVNSAGRSENPRVPALCS